MARGDPIFARVDISILFDPNLRKLSATHKWAYMTLYLSAVECRSELLPPSFDLQTVCDRAGIDTKTARKFLEKSLKIGLLEEPAPSRIRVIGTRANHPKLDWDELSLDSPYGADTGLKREENKIKEKENTREEGAGAASLRVPSAHASPPALYKNSSENQAFDEGWLVKGLLKNINPASATERPEIEPTDQQIAEAEKTFSSWGIGELVRYSATNLKTGNLTDTLNEALRMLPENKLREICVYVIAKAGANSGRGWATKKSGAILTARCKEIMARTHE